jgi:leucyl-tRNA synthetase
MILGEDGSKMSKSRGNVINPDTIVEEYGADTLRMYEMFMGPLEAMKPWSTLAVEGSRRFVERVYRFYTEMAVVNEQDTYLEKIYHQTVKKVTEDYENLRFNTAIAQMMMFMNECYKHQELPKVYLDGFLQLMNPIAPHVTEELWNSVLHHNDSITYALWPKYDNEKTVEDLITVVIQVNGKIRDKLEVANGSSKEELTRLALELPKIKQLTENTPVKKIIVVPDKLVNIVL